MSKPDTLSDVSLSASYENHPVHYFQDGNIIFVLEGRVRFKLYRGIISRYSEVLANMLDIPQPVPMEGEQSVSTDTQELIEGIPAVHLTDKADGFAALLDVVIPPITEQFYEEQQKCEAMHNASLDKIGAILELSRKYIVPAAEAWAKMALNLQFPVPSTEALEMSETPEDMFESSKDAAMMIHIARAQELPQYLPLAFYFLATQSELDTVFQDQSLSPADCARIYKGRVKMNNAVVEIVAPRPENGTSRGTCCSGCMESWWKEYTPDQHWNSLINNPLEELKWRFDRWDGIGRSASCCKEKIRLGFKEDRREVYRRIKEFFDL
ncbi:hypothetical protein FRC03_011016 [Tulasnella sp. 419]|nr:hypothetical protein FRC02_009536 [Tulasnella sp. 418]KAG8966945.1 hypothetical protein FRC03_011016 [Tulasnella sp. 419]